PDRVDVRPDGARQRGDDRAFDRTRNAAAGLEVARRGDREAGFDHVHSEPRQLVGHLQLGFRAHPEAGRLLAVAEGGVEDVDLPVGGRGAPRPYVVLLHRSAGSSHGIIDRSSAPTFSIWCSAFCFRISRNFDLPLEFSSIHCSAKEPSWISLSTWRMVCRTCSSMTRGPDT